MVILQKKFHRLIIEDIINKLDKEDLTPRAVAYLLRKRLNFSR